MEVIDEKIIYVNNQYSFNFSCCIFWLTSRTKYVAGDSDGFGETEIDKEMFSYFCEKYGDLDDTGNSRFIELVVTNKLEMDYPLTKIFSFPIDVDGLFIWLFMIILKNLIVLNSL